MAFLPDGLEKLVTVHVRHHNIADNQLGHETRFQNGERLASIAGSLHHVTFQLQD